MDCKTIKGVLWMKLKISLAQENNEVGGCTNDGSHGTVATQFAGK